MTQNLLTTAQVAKRLGKSVRTVHRMAKDGRLPYVMKVDGDTGTYLFDPADIERAEAEREAEAVAS